MKKIIKAKKSKILENAATKLLKRVELGDKLKELGKKNKLNINL